MKINKTLGKLHCLTLLVFFLVAPYSTSFNDIMVEEIHPVESIITALELMETDSFTPTLDQELLLPSNLTVEQLESGLLKSLKPYAADFIQAEQETGVNAVFLAAVAGLESGWGESWAAEYRNNLFGWGQQVKFSSKERCIETVAQSLKDNYLTEGGIYFNGYSVEAVGTHYNGTEGWNKQVRLIMKNIEDRIEER